MKKKQYLNEVFNGADTENVMVEMNAFGSLTDRDLGMVVGGLDDHSKSSRNGSKDCSRKDATKGDQGKHIYEQSSASKIY